MKKIPKSLIEELKSTYKVGLVATIDDAGEPHITFISTLQANSETQMITGEFIKGLSKDHMQARNKVGFFSMSLEKKWTSGKANWTHLKKNGDAFEMYNRVPMFRYNTYFGIHTVHYFDLVDIAPNRPLKMGAIITNAVFNIIQRGFFKRKNQPNALKPWAYSLLKGLGTLKFIAYIGEDGYPVIVPIIQAQACSKSRIVLPKNPYAQQLDGLKSGMKVAIMGANLDMETLLVKGEFSGFKNGLFGKVGHVDIARVYNAMPPVHGYIYP
jgi:hypothetical protein